VDLPEEAKRAPPAPVWNQSFPSPKALFVRGTFFIRCCPLVHSRGHSPICNLGTRVAAVVPQLASGTASATDTTTIAIKKLMQLKILTQVKKLREPAVPTVNTNIQTFLGVKGRNN